MHNKHLFPGIILERMKDGFDAVEDASVEGWTVHF